MNIRTKTAFIYYPGLLSSSAAFSRSELLVNAAGGKDILVGESLFGCGGILLRALAPESTSWLQTQNKRHKQRSIYKQTHNIQVRFAFKC